MAATTGYAVGVESTNTSMSYAFEVAWGTTPAVAFQAFRTRSGIPRYQKDRQRPNENNGTREAAQAVTLRQSVSGTIQYYTSRDNTMDFWACCMQAEWGAAIAVQGIAADITLTNTAGVITISSTLATKFLNYPALSWIRLLGFTNAANNDLWFISIKTSNQLMTLTGPNSASVVTETPTGTNAKIRGRSITNGSTFKSMTLQWQAASNLFLYWNGSYVSRMTVTAAVGSFFSGAIDIIAKQETAAAVSQSTGAIVAAPTYPVVDPVGGFVAAYWNEGALGSAIDQVGVTVENTNATPGYQLGSAVAAGMLGGVFTATFTFRAYFKNFTDYTRAANETSGRFSMIYRDPQTGNVIALTLLNAVLTCSIEVGEAGTPVYANFIVEGGPNTVTGQGTMVLDQVAAS